MSDKEVSTHNLALWCFVVLLIQTPPPIKCDEFERWCDPYETFCLFSPGVQTTVSNLIDAQEVCSGSKENSWSLEIYDDHVKQIVDNFTSEHFSDGDYSFILNENKIGSTWQWIKNRPTYTNQNCNGPILVYDSKNKQIQCSNGTPTNVICMTNCYATWDVRSNTGVNDVNLVNPTFVSSEEDCRNICETDKTLDCIAFQWARSMNANCWLYVNEIGKIALYSSSFQNNAMQYIIDRTRKTVDVCLAGLKPSTKAETNGITNKFTVTEKVLIGIFVPIVAVLIILIPIVIVQLYKHFKSRKVREPNSTAVDDNNDDNNIYQQTSTNLQELDSPQTNDEHVYKSLNNI